MKSSELRRSFIDFFKSKNHTFVPSSSTIPAGDQTILFTIAGMAQFKAALTGEEIRPYKRATNCQKCIRIGDLDDVGKDGRHCTMFEMLGSWSFGDYYKHEAIQWAYELVRDVLKFDLSKFWVSVFQTDDEAFAIWKKTGVPADRIVRLGEKDNFWAMGPTGPCGPCTELHLDQGEAAGKCHVKGFDCKKQPGCDCDRFLEFWNLVFMQYDRKEDGTLVELPFKSVDTGSGLERVTALVQGKTSAFEIDTFLNIKKAILERAGLGADASLNPLQKESLNVVADHIRTLTFPLADGANFSNEGRGYVLRRVLRRAARHVHRLNPRLPKDKSFLADIVPAVVKEMGDFYPEIIENQKRVQDLIQHEELRFMRTLENGLEKFNSFVTLAKQRGHTALTGEQIFVLHDSFGFPSDLTRVLCEEIGLKTDMAGFQQAMEQQREKSRAEAHFYKFDQDDSPWVILKEEDAQEEKSFSGYGIENHTAKYLNKNVTEILLDPPQLRRVRQLKNKYIELVIANTPFYPESGGQVADVGWLRTQPKSDTVEWEIVDVRKTPAAIVHVLRNEDYCNADAANLSSLELKNLFSGQTVGVLDLSARQATARNHTATHLLHRALQLTLGENVRQAGSLVSPTGLRFDFSHNKAVSAAELEIIERIVNEEILKDTEVHTHVGVPLDEARKMGAMAIFDEKYEDRVRVLEVPGFSMELCGGTHVRRTGTIGLFKIISEGSVTSGVRRIEAVTAFGVSDFISRLQGQIRNAAEEAHCSEADLAQRVGAMRENIKETERIISTLQSRLVNGQIAELMARATELKPGLKLVSAVLDVSDAKELELYADRLKEKNVGVVVIGAKIQDKAMVLSAVHPELQKEHKNLSAGSIVKQLSELVDGKGGGRPDFARGGGNSPEKLPAAFGKLEALVKALL